MPTWNEFAAHFGFKELIFTLFITAIILIAREQKRIFGRKKNDTPHERQ